MDIRLFQSQKEIRILDQLYSLMEEVTSFILAWSVTSCKSSRVCPLDKVSTLFDADGDYCLDSVYK